MNLPIFNKEISYKEAFNVFLCILIGAAFAGFVVGINEDHSPTQSVQFNKKKNNDLTTQTIAPAVSYSDMNARERGLNKDWQVNLDTLVNQAPAVLDPVPIPNLPDKLASLEKRNSRRAYDGAPPLVPHKVDQRTADSCLTCHGQDMKIGKLLVPKISHPHYSNCTQCHVEMENPHLTMTKDLENSFEGKAPPIEGKRAWFGAPPIIPHQVHMRDDCNSCHGVTGLPGIRTTHPERQNCMQCHAPSAEMNQQPLLPPSLVLEWHEVEQNHKFLGRR